MSVIQKGDRWFILHIQSGRLFRRNFQQEVAAIFIAEALQQQWDQGISLEIEDLTTHFTDGIITEDNL